MKSYEKRDRNREEKGTKTEKKAKCTRRKVAKRNNANGIIKRKTKTTTRRRVVYRLSGHCM